MEHLPECSAQFISDPCICKYLRACEQRVDDENFRLLPAYDRARQQGYAAALDAAREAVAALWQHKGIHTGPMMIDFNKALAAIDALRGER